jgi:hypothetical protein
MDNCFCCIGLPQITVCHAGVGVLTMASSAGNSLAGVVAVVHQADGGFQADSGLIVFILFHALIL